ncbi:calcium/sodium antiporter [Synechococcus sp. RSCCF101]|uniref:calcium/sodium antiporter n=1 Tax=Synechococcus sp. RSCCF101 TaxID=2511069 RepID=UPI001244A2B2|nr:calcium/sodium antiporter [Synechococcus sp. RSCCF101]QEY31299.1 calcium/sodium antiporter [Synechococcus sp. RSCCF101]
MTDFLIDVVQVLVGILLLFFGGELFVQGSVAIALILGVPQLVIGLTVVSLGTSAPELFVSLGSIAKGSADLATSNVVGSNIFNVMVVLGCSAAILPLKVESRLVRRDVPILIAVSMAVWGMASAGVVTWQAGLALVTALVINTIWEVRTAREDPEGSGEAEPEVSEEAASGGWAPAALRLAGGMALLVIGSRILVIGASGAALTLGVSETVIGLTIVSAGTSMPELVASVVAALRGATDLAIGNVIGSNLLNQLLILGSCGLVSGGAGLQVDPVLINRDMPVMLLATFACLPIFWTRGRISRLEGGVLLTLYVLYLCDQVLPHTLPTWRDEFRLVVLCLVLPAVLVLILVQAIIYWQQRRRKREQA